jgi:CheY-like chemotaxis protein
MTKPAKESFSSVRGLADPPAGTPAARRPFRNQLEAQSSLRAVVNGGGTPRTPLGSPNVATTGRQVEIRPANQNERPVSSVHILLVEDHLPTATAMADLLTGFGYSVTVTHNLHEARVAAAREPPQVLVSDIDLPDGSGRDLMRELHERYRMHGVAVSGHSLDEDRQNSLAAGFDTHLAKPIRIQELRTAVAHATRPGA